MNLINKGEYKTNNKISSLLVILTHAYPYAPPSEQFLHAELDELSSVFDEIVIFPLSRSAWVKGKNNIKYQNVYIERIKNRNLLVSIIKILFSITFYKELIYLIATYGFSKKAWRSFIITSYARIKYAEKVFRILKKRYLIKASNIIIYSYWFSHYANVACVIKDKITSLNTGKVHAVARAHGSYDLFLTKETIGYRPYQKELNKKLNAIFSISEMGANYLVRNGIIASKIHVSRLGVSNACGLVKYVKDRPVIISCSRLIPLKRIELLILALERTSIPKLCWMHIGDGPLFTEIKKLAEEKLKGKVDFQFLGALKNDDIIPLYLRNSPIAFINLSLIEGIPVSIMEACSCGIPIIATDVGGTNEIVQNGLNGVLLTPNVSADEIAKVIHEIYYKDMKDWLNLSNNSYEVYLQKYNSVVNYGAFSNELLLL